MVSNTHSILYHSSLLINNCLHKSFWEAYGTERFIGLFFNFSDYMRRAVESAQEAFKMYDNEPEDMQLTYQELQKVSLKVI